MSVVVTRRTRVRPRSRTVMVARRLDWLLLGATAGLIALGLTVLGDATRLDIAGDPGYYVRRQTVYFAVGVAGMIAMMAMITLTKREPTENGKWSCSSSP